MNLPRFENCIIKYETFELSYLPYKIEGAPKDLDVVVSLGGKSYFIWAVTIEFIQEIMAKDFKTGESAKGSYFWLIGMLIVKELKIECIANSINNLLLEDKDWFETNGVPIKDDSN